MHGWNFRQRRATIMRSVDGRNHRYGGRFHRQRMRGAGGYDPPAWRERDVQRVPAESAADKLLVPADHYDYRLPKCGEPSNDCCAYHLHGRALPKILYPDREHFEFLVARREWRPRK